MYCRYAVFLYLALVNIRGIFNQSQLFISATSKAVDSGRVEFFFDFHDFWGDFYSIFCPTYQTPRDTFHTCTMVARPSKEMKLENPDLSQCSFIAEDNVIPLTAAFLPSLILNGLQEFLYFFLYVFF